MRRLSNKRKADTRGELSAVGLEPGDPFVSVAVVAENLTATQRNLFMIQNINIWLDDHIGVDFAAFIHHSVRPFMIPLFPVFGITKLFDWRGPVVATNINTALDALDTLSERIVHYAFDLDFVGRRDLSIGDIGRAFTDPRVTVVVRGGDHREVVEKEFGIECFPKVVPNFEVGPLLEAALGVR